MQQALTSPGKCTQTTALLLLLLKAWTAGPTGQQAVIEAFDLIYRRFCYHHRLSIAGNCRMCLVEVGAAAYRRSTEQQA
jgi:hypothetical protein